MIGSLVQVCRVSRVLACGGRRQQGGLCRGDDTELSLERMSKNFQGHRSVGRALQTASVGLKERRMMEGKTTMCQALF